MWNFEQRNTQIKLRDSARGLNSHIHLTSRVSFIKFLGTQLLDNRNNSQKTLRTTVLYQDHHNPLSLFLSMCLCFCLSVSLSLSLTHKYFCKNGCRTVLSCIKTTFALNPCSQMLLLTISYLILSSVVF